MTQWTLLHTDKHSDNDDDKSHYIIINSVHKAIVITLHHFQSCAASQVHVNPEPWDIWWIVISLACISKSSKVCSHCWSDIEGGGQHLGVGRFRAALLLGLESFESMQAYGWAQLVWPVCLSISLFRIKVYHFVPRNWHRLRVWWALHQPPANDILYPVAQLSKVKLCATYEWS